MAECAHVRIKYVTNPANDSRAWQCSDCGADLPEYDFSANFDRAAAHGERIMKEMAHAAEMRFAGWADTSVLLPLPPEEQK